MEIDNAIASSQRHKWTANRYLWWHRWTTWLQQVCCRIFCLLCDVMWNRMLSNVVSVWLCSVSAILLSLEKKNDPSQKFHTSVTREDMYQRGMKQWSRQKWLPKESPCGFFHRRICNWPRWSSQRVSYRSFWSRPKQVMTLLAQWCAQWHNFSWHQIPKERGFDSFIYIQHFSCYVINIRKIFLSFVRNMVYYVLPDWRSKWRSTAATVRYNCGMWLCNRVVNMKSIKMYLFIL